MTSEDGITQSTLENQIKETLRQIGAKVEEEDVEFGTPVLAEMLME